MATTQSATNSRRTLRFGVPAVVILFAMAAVVSYYGIRPVSGGRQPSEVFNSRPPEAVAPGSPVVSIVLPYEEPDLPPGPHRAEFQVTCTACHSTRLAMTQPPFPKAKWEATVKKMVDAYGAPLHPEDQARAVEYLTAVRGQ
jgi:hypothetical protein